MKKSVILGVAWRLSDILAVARGEWEPEQRVA